MDTIKCVGGCFEVSADLKTKTNLGGNKYLYPHALYLEEKSADDDKRIVSGYFTTIDKDRVGDITLPTSFSNWDEYAKNPIVFFNHNMYEPIGRTLKWAIEKNKGVHVDIYLSTVDDKYYTWVKEGVLNAFSFAYIVNDEEYDEERDVWILKDVSLWEISLVTIPANPHAIIDSVKNIKSLWSSAQTVKFVPNTTVDASVTNSTFTPDSRTSAVEPDTPYKVATVSNLPDDQTVEPEVKAVVPFQDLPVNSNLDASWSFSAADGNAIIDKGGWALYKKAHVWFDPDNTEVKSGYKFPIAKLVDGQLKVFWHAVSAAMAIINGGRGGTNIPDNEKKGVYNHLVKYYKKFDKEPPDYAKYVTPEIFYRELNQMFTDMTEELKANLEQLTEEFAKTLIPLQKRLNTLQVSFNGFLSRMDKELLMNEIQAILDTIKQS